MVAPQGLGGTVMGPFPVPGARPVLVRRYSLLAVTLLIISSFLIGLNAAALLWPSFFAFWVTWFPWVAFLGNFSFILGTILSFIILGAVFLYMLGFKVLAAFLVFPTAIVSLFIGGGFIIGLILGVITGILMIWRS